MNRPALTKGIFTIFDEKNQTLRQMPQNYLLAQRINKKWHCVPDRAANKLIVMTLFELLFDEYDALYGDGNFVLKEMHKRLALK